MLFFYCLPLFKFKIFITFAYMKAELLHKIQYAGLANVYEKRPEWVAAFEYYWQQTGDYNLKMGCTHCYVKILEWLKK